MHTHTQTHIYRWQIHICMYVFMYVSVCMYQPKVYYCNFCHLVHCLDFSIFFVVPIPPLAAWFPCTMQRSFHISIWTLPQQMFKPQLRLIKCKVMYKHGGTDSSSEKMKSDPGRMWREISLSLNSCQNKRWGFFFLFLSFSHLRKDLKWKPITAPIFSTLEVVQPELRKKVSFLCLLLYTNLSRLINTQ